MSAGRGAGRRHRTPPASRPGGPARGARPGGRPAAAAGRRGQRGLVRRAGRRGARPGGRVGVGQDHGRPGPAWPRPPRAVTSAAARSCWTGSTCSRSPGALRRLRGAKVSYVPQDPSAALNPTLRIGSQLREALRVHAGAGLTPRPGWPRSCGRCASSRAGHAAAVPAPALRRPAAAGRAGHGLRLPAVADRAGRADDRPRRIDPAPRARHVRSLCHRTGWRPSMSATTWRWSADWRPRWRSCTRGGSWRSGHASLAVPPAAAPLYPRAARRGALARAAPRLLTGIHGQQPAPGQRGRGCSFAPRCALALAQCRDRGRSQIIVAGRTVRCWRAAECAAGQPARAALPALGTAEPGTAVLSLRGVCASYGARAGAVRHRPGRAPGSCIAIVGESGSGKTTLARCIVGLHRNWTGEIALHGSPLAHGARHRPKRC